MLNEPVDLSKWGGKIKTLFQSDKGRKILLIIGFAGILLIFLSSLFKGDAPKTSARQNPESTEEYIAAMENKLSKILESINGVGNVKVMITLENSGENIYAVEQKSNTDKSEDTTAADSRRVTEKDSNEEKITVIDGRDGKEAVVRTQIEPKVKGVVVVCSGGDQQIVQQRVTSAVTTVLDVAPGKVCVTKLT